MQVTLSETPKLGLLPKRYFLLFTAIFAILVLQSKGAWLENLSVKFIPKNNTSPVKGIPQSWVDKKGLDVLRYANFIQDLGLKNITSHDVLAPQMLSKKRIQNSLPPRYMWENIVPTLRLIDKMSTYIKAEVHFVAIYRTPYFNRAMRGRSKSQLLINRGVRVQFKGVDSAVVARVARRFREAGHFSGGVGKYTKYTHIDTRGHNADW